MNKSKIGKRIQVFDGKTFNLLPKVKTHPLTPSILQSYKENNAGKSGLVEQLLMDIYPEVVNIAKRDFLSGGGKYNCKYCYVIDQYKANGTICNGTEQDNIGASIYDYTILCDTFDDTMYKIQMYSSMKKVGDVYFDVLWTPTDNYKKLVLYVIEDINSNVFQYYKGNWF